MSLLPLTSLVMVFVVVGGLTLLTGLLLLRWWPEVRAERLQGVATAASPTSILRWDDTGRPSWWQRIFEIFGKAAAPKDAAKVSRLRRRLSCAGYNDPRAPQLFVGAKVTCAVLFGLLLVYGTVLAHQTPSLWLSMTFAVSYFLPDVWLRSRTKERQRAIVHALPDVLDLLMVCVESGMGFDAAVARIVEQPTARRNPLLEELARMQLEVRAGRPREEAMHALGERAGAREVKSVVAAFIQTHRMGASIGKTLRVHADTARVERRHRAEEKGYLAPLKMLFPTVAFLMPAFFLVAMAPALLGLLQVLRNVSK